MCVAILVDTILCLCRNSVLICQTLPMTHLPDINSHSKFEENWLKMLPAESKNDALTDGRTDRRTDGHSNAIF